MTLEFSYLMNLIGCGMQGAAPKISPDSISWKKIYDLANEQTVAAMLAYTLRANAAIYCKEDLRDSMISSMHGMVIKNYICREQIMALLKKLYKHHIRVVLLKGYAVAGEYASPDCRISADTDIWVAPVDETRACELLMVEGFTIEQRWKNGHHTVCHHPQMGCVELHVILYDEIVEEVWFDKMDGSQFVHEPFEKVRYGDAADDFFYTLGKTDNLLFLTLHMVKHFILSGMSLRMIMDVALFMKNHHTEIDLDRYWTTIRSLKYEKCVSSILSAMIQYAGFHVKCFPGLCPTNLESIEEIMSDLENGGWLGIKDKANRKEGWEAFNREILIRNKSEISYRLYMLKWQYGSYIRIFLPSKRSLEKQYPYLTKKPWLFFYALLHRLFVKGFQRLKRRELKAHIVLDESLIATSGRNRLEMFRRLGMLKSQ